MEYNVAWIILIIATAAIEAMTAGLVTIWFTIGAVFALIASVAGLNIYIQIAVFLIISVLALLITRPLVKNKLSAKKTNTNADMVLGKEALVVEEINPDKNIGQVRINGQIWSAKSFNNETIEQDKKVIVEKIAGVHLIVKERG